LTEGVVAGLILAGVLDPGPGGAKDADQSPAGEVERLGRGDGGEEA